MSRFDLVIFDCDGVLIDSERLAVRTEATILAALGWSLSESDIAQQFAGRSAAYMQGEIERQIGRPVDWEVEFEAEYRRVFKNELVPIDGIVDVLNAITIPCCVASSSTHEMLRFTLGLTSLYERFAESIFSVQDVDRGKPEPDLYLYAAHRMGVAPDRCAVIEDSISGVAAGVAAGMAVFAFGGGVTDASSLERAGGKVFAHMRELLALLQGN